MLLTCALQLLTHGQKQINKGTTNLFNKISDIIDAAEYEAAYREVEAYQAKDLNQKCEKDILLGRIFLAQGAYYLAEQRMNAALKFEKIVRPEIIEKAFMLRGDIYYQMFEFDRNYNNTLELGRFWQKKFPRDEFRKSMLHTLKAQYFAALIKGDSARFHTVEALRLFRTSKVNESEVPLWAIYSNHVTCLRNGMGAPNDGGHERQFAYSDTCITLLNAWFPEDNIEKLRIIQSLSIINFDRVAGYDNWVSMRDQTAYYFSKYLSIANRLIAFYTQKAGLRHPFNAQLKYLVGLAYHYKRDTLNEYLHYKQSVENTFSAPGMELPFCLSWRRYFSLMRFYPFVQSKLEFKGNRYQQLLSERAGLQRCEELFYLRYFYNAILLNKPEDDAYLANPFLDLEEINFELYNLTGNRQYLFDAWAAGQKGKYTDLLRQRYRELNVSPAKKFLENCHNSIDRMRLLNDSILLCSNRFADFKTLKIASLSQRLRTSYIQFKNEIRNEQISDPLAGKFLNEHEAFTPLAVQKTLKGKQAAWLDISRGGKPGSHFVMIWYITSDTIWANQIQFSNQNNFSLYQFLVKLHNISSKGWKTAGFIAYTQLFKHDFDVLRSRHIKRIYYASMQDYTDFSPEMLATDTTNHTRTRFLIDEFAFSTQLGAPTAFHQHFLESHKNLTYSRDVFVPKTPNKLIDLVYARQKARLLAQRYSMNLFEKTCESEEFLNRLKTAHTIQVFSHGEGEKGIWFSDRLIAPSEIRTMKIPAELVSLTTCDSYTGELVRNEGMRGMVEAFSRAGARRILAGLWKIDERASSEIITHFYSELFRETAPDIALQKAKIQFLNSAHPEEQHPYYWSGIQLFGNPIAYPLDNATHSKLIYSTIFFVICFFAVVIIMLKKSDYRNA
jgi:hypothetical protein